MTDRVSSLDGEKMISIGEMSRRSHVSPSAIRGYEKLGLLQQYEVLVVRDGNIRYFRQSDAFRLAQVKADRVTARNLKLAAQGPIHG